MTEAKIKAIAPWFGGLDQERAMVETRAVGGDSVRQDELEVAFGVFWLTNKPTIAELRRLNRESWMPGHLEILFAIVDAGVDLDVCSEAVVRQVLHQGSDVISFRYVVELKGKTIAVVEECDEFCGLKDQFGFKAVERT